MIAYEIFWGAWPCSEWDSRLDLKETKTLDLFPKASARRAGLKSGQGGPFFRLMDSSSFNTSTGFNLFQACISRQNELSGSPKFGSLVCWPGRGHTLHPPFDKFFHSTLGGTSYKNLGRLPSRYPFGRGGDLSSKTS